jgi:hypothetical protein
MPGEISNHQHWLDRILYSMFDLSRCFTAVGNLSPSAFVTPNNVYKPELFKNTPLCKQIE